MPHRRGRRADLELCDYAIDALDVGIDGVAVIASDAAGKRTSRMSCGTKYCSSPELSPSSALDDSS
jgi:hypothetical protein